MGNVEVIYGGASYTVVDKDVVELEVEIEEILRSGSPGWITAYDGRGTRHPYRLLVADGVPIVLATAPSE